MGFADEVVLIHPAVVTVLQEFHAKTGLLHLQKPQPASLLCLGGQTLAMAAGIAIHIVLQLPEAAWNQAVESTRGS